MSDNGYVNGYIKYIVGFEPMTTEFHSGALTDWL